MRAWDQPGRWWEPLELASSFEDEFIVEDYGFVPHNIPFLVML